MRIRNLRRASVLALALILGFSLVGTRAFAAGTVGNFEIDGDRADTVAGDPIDWNTPPPNLTSITDLTKSASDDAFAASSLELQPGKWMCTSGGLPQKYDIAKGAVSLRTLADGTQYLIVNWQRVQAPAGDDAHVDFEFNRSTAAGPCTGVPLRSNGDLLVTFDMNAGTPVLRAWTWAWTGVNQGVFLAQNVGGEHVGWDAAINSTTVTDPGLTPAQFGEASLDLTHTVGAIGCNAFGGVYMKTRTGFDINANIRDKTAVKPLFPSGCASTLSISKKVTSGAKFAPQGSSLDYTITYGNSGAPVANASIQDVLSPGTVETACSDSCTVSGNVVTWNFATLPTGTGAVSLTVRIDLVPFGCMLCNQASISAPSVSAPIFSAPLCVTLTPQPMPSQANANGNSFGAHVATGSLDQTLSPTSSSLTNGSPPSDSHFASVADVNVPPPSGSAFKASVVRSTATSSVSPNTAEQTSTAETLGLNINNGTVTADLVRGVAYTLTGPRNRISSDAGSTFGDLKIDPDGATGPQQPVAYQHVAPNTTVDLSATFFGSGSYVKLYSSSPTTSAPLPPVLALGRYFADQTTIMVDVHIVDRDPITPGNQSLDVQVSKAVAHSDFPQRTLCDAHATRGAAAHAFILSEVSSSPMLNALIGFVDVPPGTNQHQDLNSFAVPQDGTNANGATSSSDARMSLTATNSSSSAYAQTTGLCAIVGTSGCSISATALKSQVASAANSGGASSSLNGTQFLNLKVMGTPVSDSPNPNMMQNLGSFGFVMINEQFCDNGSLPTCSGSPDTGLTVRTLRIVITGPNPPGIPPGTVIIICESHSEALFQA